ncbi:MAG: DUF4082 domain-containing protein [Saccharothrix sp.]|nr:DUF4082 domain-containing protein [Saccharothrix sp.]
MSLPGLVRAVVAALVLSTVVGGRAEAAEPPQSAIIAPTSGSRVEVGEPVLVLGSGDYWRQWSERVTEFQVSFDGGETWEWGHYSGSSGSENTPVRYSWAYDFTPTEPGVYTIVSRVNTDTVYGAISAPTTLYVGVPAPAPSGSCAPCRLDLGPRNPNRYDDEGRSVSVGLRFSVDRPGFITGIEHGQEETANLAHLWRSDGTLLAQQRVAGGGRNLPFPTPVAVVPGEEYVVDLTLFGGRYVSHDALHTATLLQSPFIVPAQGGVYAYDEQFPNLSWHDSNYVVTPVFRTS